MNKLMMEAKMYTIALATDMVTLPDSYNHETEYRLTNKLERAFQLCKDMPAEYEDTEDFTLAIIEIAAMAITGMRKKHQLGFVDLIEALVTDLETQIGLDKESEKQKDRRDILSLDIDELDEEIHDCKNDCEAMQDDLTKAITDLALKEQKLIALKVELSELDD